MSLGLGPARRCVRRICPSSSRSRSRCRRADSLPTGSRAHRDPARAVSDADRGTRLLVLRVDPVDAPRAGARDPDEPRSHRDRGRIAVYGDRLHHRPGLGRCAKRSSRSRSRPRSTRSPRRRGRAGSPPPFHEPVVPGVDRSGRVGSDLRERVRGAQRPDHEDDRPTTARATSPRAERHHQYFQRRPARARRTRVRVVARRSRRGRAQDPASGSLVRARGGHAPARRPRARRAAIAPRDSARAPRSGVRRGRGRA